MAAVGYLQYTGINAARVRVKILQALESTGESTDGDIDASIVVERWQPSPPLLNAPKPISKGVGDAGSLF
ncbi:hypothetical protein [Candidatus Microthrix parvicella]|uniref:hypothetical protein n=1 Tax=Candidatus Neomicrothrix parvicella TaxID=41950 RepID=UPI0003678208|nr:hypothetical protein [Candidatus Microthrix parvicella]